MKKITLMLTALMFVGGVAFAQPDKGCCKKGEAKTECSKEKKEACAKGEGCCSKKTSTLNEKESKADKKADKKAEKAKKANS